MPDAHKTSLSLWEHDFDLRVSELRHKPELVLYELAILFSTLQTDGH